MIFINYFFFITIDFEKIRKYPRKYPYIFNLRDIHISYSVLRKIKARMKCNCPNSQLKIGINTLLYENENDMKPL